MTPIMMFARFKSIFPEHIPHVVKYKNNKAGGIDIWFDDGSILNFVINSKGNWILKGSDRRES